MQLPRVRDIGPQDPTIQLARASKPQGVEPETNELPPQPAAPEAEAPDEGLTCPNCGQRIWPDDNFCESCRTELAPAVSSGDPAETTASCPNCADSAISPEGYCESCGYKVPSGRDHVEIDLGLVAGVTDRGIRHTRNEDAMALATANSTGGPVALAVVCDGVSTSSNPDEASQKAAQSAVQVLLGAVRSSADLANASARAVMAAQKALADMAEEADLFGNAPSATFVSAVVTATEATVCWLGDSRAYWIDAAGPEQADTEQADTEQADTGQADTGQADTGQADTGQADTGQADTGQADTGKSRQLTVDDSVAQELIAAGMMSEAEALASPQGHVVTGWIGADAREAKPHVCVFAPQGPGLVLLCSDGLWNYQPDAAGIAGLAGPHAINEPLSAAGKLVDFAIERGGSDNITVVLIPFPPRRRPDNEGLDPESTAIYAATKDLAPATPKI